MRSSSRWGRNVVLLSFAVFACAAASPASDTATRGILFDSNNPIPYYLNTTRFTACDRGDPILYRVDTNLLPVGITPARALAAVSNALTAWSAVSTVRFQFDGAEAFGAAATNLNKWDYRIWIQLYNYGNSLPGPTLGYGSFGYYNSPGDGGKIGSSNYFPSVWGYVIINHTNSFFANSPTNLEEVLAHELGHVLALAHNTSDTNALMRSYVFGNGRGALLSTGDVAQISALYPSNTPPYGMDRVLYILTRPTVQLSPQAGTNGMIMTAYDLQSTNLTILYDSSSAYNGRFSTNSRVLGYTPSNYFYAEEDPASGNAYDFYKYRISDGTNKSPSVEIRVIAYYPDANSDYLPDVWMAQYPGLAGGANGNPDADKFTNYQEWMLGTNPTNALSRFAIQMFETTNLTWTAKPYELYEVQSTTNLAAGYTCYKPVIPTSSVGRVSFSPTSAVQRFFHVRHIY